LFFDIEALIVQLLSEEYGALSPATLEAQGLISQTEFCKILALTHSASPDAQQKIAGKHFFVRVLDLICFWVAIRFVFVCQQSFVHEWGDIKLPLSFQKDHFSLILLHYLAWAMKDFA
jgi:hypothetical protein